MLPIILIGIVVGFLSGLLGKGGSAITTPALNIFAGIPPLLALASPLPSSIPITLSASFAYRGSKLIRRKVVLLTVLIGIPSTILGSYFSDWISGPLLMLMTATFVIALGISLLVPAFIHRSDVHFDDVETDPPSWKIVLIGLFVGTLSGLLANSGGVLYGPLFIRVLKLKTKEALASSLIVSAWLAIPGTLTHWWLGHINWWIVLLLSVSAIPSSYLGAKLALKLRNATLELVFGAMLCIFGAYDLFFTLRGPF